MPVACTRLDVGAPNPWPHKGGSARSVCCLGDRMLGVGLQDPVDSRFSSRNPVYLLAVL